MTTAVSAPARFGRVIVLSSPSGDRTAVSNAVQQVHQQTLNADRGMMLSSQMSRVEQDAQGNRRLMSQAALVDGPDAQEVQRRSTVQQPAQGPSLESMMDQVFSAGLSGQWDALFQLTNQLTQAVSQTQQPMQQTLNAYVQERLQAGADASGQPVLRVMV